MKANYNNMNNNFNINNMIKWIYLLSFLFQWSIISMIINLFTWGFLTIPLLVVILLDFISMYKMDNKTIKKPSFILSKLWSLIDYFVKPENNYPGSTSRFTRFFNNLSIKVQNTVNSINNNYNNLKDSYHNFINDKRKYRKERARNKFSDEVGNKITVEYIEEGKIHKKSFKYKDRLQTYIKVLESNGYKNYAEYNLDISQGYAYLIVNNNRDIIDINNYTIKINHNSPDYHLIVDGWHNQ